MSKGGRWWEGCRMLLLGFTQMRGKTLKNLVEEHGGIVHMPPAKVASIFMSSAKRKKTELPSDLTHIVCEEKYDHAHGSRVIADLDVPSIPDSVKVVKAAWISESVKSKALQPMEPFVLSEAKQINEAAAAASQETPAGEGPASKVPAVGGKDGPTRPTGPGEWRILGSPASVHVFKCPGCLKSPRVAAFDLDSTLVVTKSGKSFPTTPSDWKWLYPSIPSKLRELHRDGYRVVILSNQNGVGKGKLSAEEMRARVAQVADALAIPVEALCATADDLYRKPRIGMWQLICEGGPTDLKESFFVGDAAGRPAVKGRKKDFSASDIMFAVNAGIDFKTPEEYFLGTKDKLHSGAEQRKLYAAGPLAAFLDKTAAQGPSLASASSSSSSSPSASASTPAAPTTAEQEAVLLIGPPGIGKTTYAKIKLPSHVWVNQDTLKTRQKCMDLARTSLASGSSVVIDATNKDRAGRREWVTLFRNALGPKGRVRFVAFLLPKSVAFHLNTFRGLNPRSEDPRRLDDIVIHSFYKYTEDIAKDEGYDELVEVKTIVPEPFKDADEERLFFMHLRG